MLIGLPSSGKTHWAINHTLNNPEKDYFMIGVANILEKMRVS